MHSMIVNIFSLLLQPFIIVNRVHGIYNTLSFAFEFKIGEVVWCRMKIVVTTTRLLELDFILVINVMSPTLVIVKDNFYMVNKM